jgi:hypothetical protein
MEVDMEERPKELVRKPYVLNGRYGLPVDHCPASQSWKGPSLSLSSCRDESSEGSRVFRVRTELLAEIFSG